MDGMKPIYDIAEEKFKEEFVTEHLDLETDEISDIELLCLQALRESLFRNDEALVARELTIVTPECKYGKEDGVCILKKGEYWIVGVYNYGNVLVTQKYLDCIDSCIRVIGKLSDSKEFKKQVLYDFYSILSRNLFSYSNDKSKSLIRR